jgi:hypothetical protein
MAAAPWVDKAFEKTILDNPKGCKEPKHSGSNCPSWRVLNDSHEARDQRL